MMEERQDIEIEGEFVTILNPDFETDGGEDVFRFDALQCILLHYLRPSKKSTSFILL